MKKANHTPPTKGIIAFCPECITYGSPMGKEDRRCGNCSNENTRLFEEIIDQAKPESPQGVGGEKIYPCADCGLMRSKEEGSTVFTVCETCWDKHYRPKIGKDETAEYVLVSKLSEWCDTYYEHELKKNPPSTFGFAYCADDLLTYAKQESVTLPLKEKVRIEPCRCIGCVCDYGDE